MSIFICSLFLNACKFWVKGQNEKCQYSYYRLVEMVDAEIGKVYDALMRSPYRGNTLFIFTADHGDGLGFHGNVSKGFMEEEAWRVPAMAVFPEHIPAGQMDSENLVSGVDIPATICDYADVPMLPKMTIGQSWRSLFEDMDTSWREYIVGETSIGQTSTAIRDSQFKTIFHMNSPSQIYDIKKDPLEQNNLIETVQGAAIAAGHRKLFRDYIGNIELCPEPTWAKLEPRQRQIYQNYLEWYGSI
jgi:arylsulfatase A-like enzyme